jgi:hypothetical protein
MWVPELVLVQAGVEIYLRCLRSFSTSVANGSA